MYKFAHRTTSVRFQEIFCAVSSTFPHAFSIRRIDFPGSCSINSPFDQPAQGRAVRFPIIWDIPVESDLFLVAIVIFLRISSRITHRFADEKSHTPSANWSVTIALIFLLDTDPMIFIPTWFQAEVVGAAPKYPHAFPIISEFSTIGFPSIL